MKRKGASMPPGTPKNGDFQIIIKNNNSTNNRIIMHNCTRNNQIKSNHYQIKHHRRYFNYFPINLNKNVLFFMFNFLLLFFASMPLHVQCDENNAGNNGEFVSGYSAGPEIFTTTEFDYANRGEKKFGDRCDSTSECGFPGSVCDWKQRTCQCVPELPATNQIDKCGKKASINESCFFNEQCEEVIHRTQCREGKCLCYLDLVPVMNKQGILVCETARPEEPKNVQYVDPAMIGILVVMALMFIIICVVLRLFSRDDFENADDEWRELNR